MTDEVAGGLDEPDGLQPEPGALRLAGKGDGWSRADWERAAAGVLRKAHRLSADDPDDAVWAALSHTTYDGIAVTPLGTADRAAPPAVPRPRRVGGWDACDRSFIGRRGRRDARRRCHDGGGVARGGGAEIRYQIRNDRIYVVGI